MNYSTSTSITTKTLPETSTDCICLPLFDNKTLGSCGQLIDKSCDNFVSRQIESFDISSEAGKTFMLPVDGKKFNRILLVGFGDEKNITTEMATKSIKALAYTLKSTNIKKLHICFEDINNHQNILPIAIRETIRAIEDARYSFDTYKSKKSPANTLEEVTFSCQDNDQENINSVCDLAQAQALGVKTAKDLGNQPSNVCTPGYIAEQAQTLANNSPNFKVKILEEADMEALNMGAFLSVSKGSTEPGKLIILEYAGGNKDEAPHMLVGKGITFDSGGISLKPGASMDEMKYDMCGAASVLGTMAAIAKIQPKINVVSIIASAENMPAGNASKPGDIVTSASGLTIEILNTDAEGRLVLCDALTYAEQYKPASVVDIATLTGACIVALGHCTSALMGNNDGLVNDLLTAGKEANDKAWQLPIGDDYQGLLDSPFADMQNIGGKGAGSITAACFLSRFAEKYPWAHLDIAGTAWVSGGKDKGATGRPVPLLLQHLLNKAVTN